MIRHAVSKFLAIAVIAVLPLSAIADPIVSLSGAYDYGPTGNASGSAILFTGGHATQSFSNVLATYPIGPSSTFYLANNTTIDLTTFNANGAPVSITSPLILTEYGPGFIATGNTATFTILGPGQLNSTGATGTVDFGFVIQLTQNNTALDFGNLFDLWSYVLSYNGLFVTPGNPGTFTVLGAPQGTSSASFTLIRADIYPGLPVPEPASVLTWSLIAGTGLLLRRRSVSIQRS